VSQPNQLYQISNFFSILCWQYASQAAVHQGTPLMPSFLPCARSTPSSQGPKHPHHQPSLCSSRSRPFVASIYWQVPLFIYTAASIRRMAQADWPGFSTEGALWFSDLTQPALILSEAGPLLPLGLPGLILPFAATAMMLTSIHLGFKASGAAARHPSVSGTFISTFLLWLRPALYALTVASAVIKVQLPQAPVLHWATTASYTLALQLGLRSARVRRLLGFSQPGSVDSSRDVDAAVVAQAAAMDNADVLVVMGAKHAALQHYNEAMHCLNRALQLDPGNTR